MLAYNGDGRGGVSIRAPARGATILMTPVYTLILVSIRAPARGATLLQYLECAFNGFQFALPRGERRRRRDAVRHDWRFQFALPRGERQPPFRGTLVIARFNSRSREGSDAPFGFVEQLARVSIRAPARGATAHQCPRHCRLVVSIRAPARGATAIIGWQVLSGLSQRRAPACQKGTG